MTSFETQRRKMVRHQIEARGIRDGRVLDAMREVPREAFLPAELADYAYEDGPLPIGSGQTISQPFIVASMVDALDLEPGDRVLEIGGGSGYAAAVISQIAGEVFAIERHGELAEAARERLEKLGYSNVHILHGDGTKGWPDEAPFDAIVVAAAGPKVPESLRQQLAVGGRMVIPVGPTRFEQRLVRVTRTDGGFEEEQLEPVRFVPLIGEEGWRESGNPGPAATASPATAHELMRRHAEPFDGLELDVEAILDRIGDARVVLLGEASHGTSEFYRLRARITRALVERRGFQMVAVEADWPDAARIDDWVRRREGAVRDWTAFARFPTWMWRNREFREFVDWLRDHNAGIEEPEGRVGFYGLDLYSLYTSIGAVLDYLDDVDPEAAEVARQRYGCLEPWERDPGAYGRAAVSGRYDDCEAEVVANLADLLQRRLEDGGQDGRRFLDAVQNARLVRNAEQYYRVMYRGSRESWNLRDSHMFETLQTLRSFYGPGSRAVVWEHNSHIGDARATEMGARGEHNVGQLCRQEYGDGAYLVGFGTHTGTVAAASNWDGPMEVKEVRPSHEKSYERLSFDTGYDAFVLPLADSELRERLEEPRLERAIGVIYRPETELASHYFQAVLPRQFDEWIFLGRTTAVAPLETADLEAVPETYPFGL
ncbi:MAG TPA: protein-L-isoaspartate(D-aspartate) O-methyltransferase [Chondromyces sp.]|nr:protein-L-isoaspartate(D-aspartate) O-methyltransferase [Chondromyces sp.]